MTRYRPAVFSNFKKALLHSATSFSAETKLPLCYCLSLRAAEQGHKGITLGHPGMHVRPLRCIGRLQLRFLHSKSEVITLQCRGWIQKPTPRGGPLRLMTMKLFPPPCSPVLFQYQSAHCSSIIQFVSLQCFSFSFPRTTFSFSPLGGAVFIFGLY